jgi:exoribonuclease-2
MFALFEEAGKFLAGRVLSESRCVAQVELESGKRVKVKAANILLKFEKPQPAELLRRGAGAAPDIELDLAWEFAPEEEFGFADLARDYFSAKATLEQQAAALLRLFEAPHYFRRAGKGRFRKAPPRSCSRRWPPSRRRSRCRRRSPPGPRNWAAGSCPPPVREQLYKILFKPDKNAPEYKAVVEASRATQTAPLALLQKAGAITSPYQFHWKRFLLEHFPKGTGFPPVAAPAIKDELPLATCRRSRSTTPAPPRSTTRCRCRAWAPAPSRWACTSPRPASPCSPARRWTRWRASACPPSTCRATR